MRSKKHVMSVLYVSDYLGWKMAAVALERNELLQPRNTELKSPPTSSPYVCFRLKTSCLLALVKRLEELASGLDNLNIGRDIGILLTRDGMRHAVRVGGEARTDRTVQRVEAAAALLGHHVLEPKPHAERAEAPEETAHRGGNKGAKHAPVVGVQALGNNQQIRRLLRVTLVKDQTEQEDGEDAAQPADDDLEAAPPVEAVDQPEDEDGDDGGGDEVGDEVDLQH